MAGKGFSAAQSYFGSFDGLVPKSSSDGATSQFAECPDEYGDAVDTASFGHVIAPTTEFAVEGDVDLSGIKLGSVVTVDGVSVMLASVAITTGANTPPTVTMTGVQVESGASAKRTYAITGTLKPRAKSQDPAGALASTANATSISTTYSVDAHVETVTGEPVAGDCSHGRVEVSVTVTDPTGSTAIAASTSGGFVFSSQEAKGEPDSDYVTRTATLYKVLAGTEADAT